MALFLRWHLPGRRTDPMPVTILTGRSKAGGGEEWIDLTLSDNGNVNADHKNRFANIRLSRDEAKALAAALTRYTTE